MFIKPKENGNYNYQLKFVLFRKNLDPMKCIQCILEVHLKNL